ncbi:hypothetical protein OHB54_44760 [Streptomyces sp. NBC_01007]|nr:hypothetical protein OHB54_44760 [Streptomyces sp. NBC_01007]
MNTKRIDEKPSDDVSRIGQGVTFLLVTGVAATMNVIQGTLTTEVSRH